MGYYDPPDVSEGTYPITCQGYLSEDDTRVVTMDMIATIARIQDAIGRGDLTAQVQLERLRLEILDMPKAVDVECGFEGKVDAQSTGGRQAWTVYWTCPRCGTEGEEDREAGDDHPDL